MNASDRRSYLELHVAVTAQSLQDNQRTLCIPANGNIKVEKKRKVALEAF